MDGSVGVPDTIDTIGNTSPIDRGAGVGAGTVGAVVAPPAPSMGNSRLRSPSTGTVQGSVPERATEGMSADGTSDGTAGLSSTGVTSQMPGGVSTDSGGRATQSGAPGGASLNSSIGSGTSGNGTANPNSGLTGDRPSNSSGYSAAPVTDPTGVGSSTGGGRRTAGAGVTGNSGGAYGATMSDCMSVWDASTHMSKEQWRTACARTTTRTR